MLKNRLIWVLLNFSHHLQPRLMSQPCPVIFLNMALKDERGIEILNWNIISLKQKNFVHASKTKLVVSKLRNCAHSAIRWFFIVAIQNETHCDCIRRQLKKIELFFLQLWRNEIIDYQPEANCVCKFQFTFLKEVVFLLSNKI